jgi:glutamine synthetase
VTWCSNGCPNRRSLLADDDLVWPVHVMTTSTGLLTIDQLRALADAAEIDTVIVGFADMQGRLVGKRISARLFLDEVLGHGVECCDYLLAVDVDMNTVEGYAFSSWESGYGDLVLTPDVETLRRIPWLPGTALVVADVSGHDGVPTSVAPRTILQAQVARLAERGLVALAGTELEFQVFDDGYRDAYAKGYDHLTAASDHNIDYSIGASSRMEPLVRAIRLGMDGAGMYCEGSKGECNFGQQEIGFRYDEVIATCDNHTIYKNGAKEIADQHGKSLTFMAKFDEREGNSCHIHLSLRANDGSAVFADDAGRHRMSSLFEHAVAGVLAATRELTLLFAPNINSYKRFARGSFAPTAVAWGLDNRTCAVRVVGDGASMRMELRVPGGDVNPYLAVAGLIAASLDGIDRELSLEEPLIGNAYDADVEHLPRTLREAVELFERSTLARRALGADVVDHYANNARIEIEAFEGAVTDWERHRGFERL